MRNLRGHFGGPVERNLSFFEVNSTICNEMLLKIQHTMLNILSGVYDIIQSLNASRHVV